MKNKYLVRPRRYERLEPSRDSRKIYIYCEGNRREFDYFKFFCGLSSNVNIIPIPSKKGKTDPNKLMEAAKEDFAIDDNMNPKYSLDVNQNDNVWFVIDTDEWGSKISELGISVSRKIIRQGVIHGLYHKAILVLKFGFIIMSLTRSQWMRMLRDIHL
ncbi:RloB family protein [Prevotella sp.]|uniref:RloB family protein n=1 Tax=Prevotella sp. TaxID=59823 RepID=UPI00307CC536